MFFLYVMVFWNLPGVVPNVAPQPKNPRLLPPRTARAKLCVKRAACGGRNVRLQSIKVLTKRLKRRREEEGKDGKGHLGRQAKLLGGWVFWGLK